MSRGVELEKGSPLVPCNDRLLTPGQAEIALFDTEGNPNSGDGTDQFNLSDVGAEVNQEPGVGVDQVRH